jgi:hypothetical protein
MPKLTEKKIMRIHANLYIKQRMTLTEIDNDQKWYDGCARYHFKRLGLNLRRPGPRREDPSIRKILAMKKAGMTNAEIAKELKLGTRQAVSMRIKRHKKGTKMQIKLNDEYMLNVGLPRGAKLEDVWGSLKGRKKVILNGKVVAVIHRIGGRLIEFKKVFFDDDGKEIESMRKKWREFVDGKWQIDRDVDSGTNRLFKDETAAAIAAIIER